jgi:D-beta-D-heptose 7-phosphate kinase/D-beta-D-heptose 1-phosphate adenosyltransferase
LKVLPELQHLIITMGGSGTSYMNVLYESEKVNVFDVVGAGDTFLAAFVYAFLFYKDHPARIDSSIRFANKAAAISVQHYGCYTLTKEDLERL